MSSFFKSSIWSRGLLSGSNKTGGDDRVGSNSDLQPMQGVDSYQAKNATHSNEQNVWAGSHRASDEWPLEYGSAPATPPKHTSIRKTTSIAVVRNPGDF